MCNLPGRDDTDIDTVADPTCRTRFSCSASFLWVSPIQGITLSKSRSLGSVVNTLPDHFLSIEKISCIFGVEAHRSTSPPKSACPGVSTAFRVMPAWLNDVYLEDIVIPRSLSITLLSMKRSSEDAIPQCASRRSINVVLP